MREISLKRIGDDFFDRQENNLTKEYYSGTHLIVLTGECIERALAILEEIDRPETFYTYEKGDWLFVVIPDMLENDFFDVVIKELEKDLGLIDKEDGYYGIRKKIPSTPDLPKDRQSAGVELIEGEECPCATIYLGRGYNEMFSRVTIAFSFAKRLIFYRVQQYRNTVDQGLQPQGESRLFSGWGAQWNAIEFAYGISSDLDKNFEAAEKAKRFLHAIVGELRRRFKYNKQKKYYEAWAEAHQ